MKRRPTDILDLAVVARDAGPPCWRLVLRALRERRLDWMTMKYKTTVRPHAAALWLLANPNRRHLLPASLAGYLVSEARPTRRAEITGEATVAGTGSLSANAVQILAASATLSAVANLQAGARIRMTEAALTAFLLREDINALTRSRQREAAYNKFGRNIPEQWFRNFRDAHSRSPGRRRRNSIE